MKVIVSKGNRNIRLGEFFTSNGTIFDMAKPCDAEFLTARVISGDAWSDFPGTYGGASIVVSERAKTVLDRFPGLDAFEFVKTMVPSFPDTCFWSLSNTLNVWQPVLEETERFSPLYRLRKDFAVSGSHIVLDQQMYKVASDELCEAFEAAGLVGFECVACIY